MSSPPADDYDVVLNATIVIDEYYVSVNKVSVSEIKQRLQRDIESKLPDGYTIDDAVHAEFSIFNIDKLRFARQYTLTVYL